MIEVTHYYGIHQGGTKDYHVYLFYSKHGAVIVKRYGKTGTDGQALVENFSVPATATRTYNKLLDERGKKGYDMRKQYLGKANCASMTEAMACLPLVHKSKITNASIAKIEGRDPTGQTGSFDPLAEKRREVFAEDMRASEEQAKLKAQADAAAELAELKANPMFGMF